MTSGKKPQKPYQPRYWHSDPARFASKPGPIIWASNQPEARALAIAYAKGRGWQVDTVSYIPKGKRNPGAAWHKEEAKLRRFWKQSKRAEEHEYSAGVSKFYGIPNPKKRRRANKKSMSSLVLIGGVLVVAYLLVRR